MSTTAPATGGGRHGPGASALLPCGIEASRTPRLRASAVRSPPSLIETSPIRASRCYKPESLLYCKKSLSGAAGPRRRVPLEHHAVTNKPESLLYRKKSLSGAACPRRRVCVVRAVCGLCIW